MARKSYTPEFKFKVVKEALQEKETLQAIASKHGVAPSQVTRWLDDFNSQGATVFTNNNKAEREVTMLKSQQTDLYAKIGELAAANDWLKKKLERLQNM